VYRPTPYQASARSWTPDHEFWDAIKSHSVDEPATATIYGFRNREPGSILSKGKMELATSRDPVGAPIFYRDVPLMPSPTREGAIKPLASEALPLIAWRLRDVSRQDSRVVLTDLPTCGNCHSFSSDGKMLGMDVDGPTGDKGAYAIVPVSQNLVIEAKDIITWNSFRDKPEGHKTIGFLSRISPDGQYVVTTVNESVHVANFMDYRFLQVFYPTRGILALYSRATGQMKALPGAGRPDYVHCDPVWSPDGKWIVFARASARDNYEEGRPLARRANDPDELPIRYDLYRMPFNEGAGGEPKPIKGASQNGMSNTFPKVSPDGRWIVFVKCRNGQLMRPDSELWIVSLEGGRARRMRANLPLMNSWHSFSPNGRWLVFSSKSNTPYTQMFLTHLDEKGNDTPAVLIPNSTKANRAVNIPEFVNIDYDDLTSIKAPTIEYYRRYQLAEELINEGRLAEAIAELRKALAAEPTSVRINLRMAFCLAQTGQQEEALAHVLRAIETGPRDCGARSNLGYLLVMLGKTDQAIEQFRKSVELDPNFAIGYHNLGRALAKKGKVEEAVGHYRKALELKPKLAGAHCDLGRALIRLHKTDEAIDALREAARLAPNSADANAALGAALDARGDTEEALRCLHRALELDPRHRGARTHLQAVEQKTSP